MNVGNMVRLACLGCGESRYVNLSRGYSDYCADCGNLQRPGTECGSHRGYQRHMRRQSPVCVPCRKSHAEHMAERRASARKPVRLCVCGTRIMKDAARECSKCRKKAEKRSDEDLIAETEVVWEPDTWGVLRAVVVKDPVPDGPTRAAARMFQDVS